MKTARKLAFRLLPSRMVSTIRAFKNPDLLIPFGDVTYNQDGLITRHSADFISDSRFAESYKKGKETESWGNSEIHWRAFVACWAADRGLRIDGDFVECGVNKGGLSRTVMEYVDFSTSSKRFFLLDTYEGLSGDYISQEEAEEGVKSGGYEPCFESVTNTFSEYDNVIIIKGAVPETLSEVDSEKIAYLSIDMNCVEPEIEAAEFFWDKLVSGATILLDDYGWTAHHLQKKAFDEFASRKNVPILALPTGQGIIIKP